jgi:hypothetical protein
VQVWLGVLGVVVSAKTKIADIPNCVHLSS